MDKSTLFMKDHLVELIEDELGWGRGGTWGNKDFEELSGRIFKSTSKKLSVTTLKRIWGRTEWVANPSVATLDILAEFLGYRNWREFVHKNEPNHREKPVIEKQRKPAVWILILLLVIFGASLSFYLIGTSDGSSHTPTFKAADFSFESRPVSTGIPNSVVFDFDASAADKNSIIEIQQDWDDTKRIVVDQEDSIATSIYYHPGFFKSKLVVDSTIVQETDVFIQTEGWLGIIEKGPHPIYLTRSDIVQEGKMAITSEIVAAHDLDPRTSRIAVGFYQVKDFGELYTDDFEMTTILKNDFKEGISGACQSARVFVLYDGGALGIPLAKKGCSSDLSLMTFEKFVNGKKNDLSGFGVDFSDYVELKCISKNNELEVLVNKSSIYKMDVPETPLKIKGLSIHFEGAGSVKNVEFAKGGKVVYSSKF